MAATFSTGQTVKVGGVIPQGPVQKVRMNDDGVIEYLISWTDADGVSQQRWFAEGDLIAVS